MNDSVEAGGQSAEDSEEPENPEPSFKCSSYARDPVQAERDFLSTVLNSIDVLVVVLDTQGRVTGLNHALERATGYTLRELEGKPLWDILIHPDEKDAVKSVFENLVEHGQPSRSENHLLAKDGPAPLFEWFNTVAKRDDGSNEHVIGTGVDITERKNVQEALQFTQFAIDRSGDGAYWMGSDARFIYVNEAACRSLGYTREELLSLTVHDIDPDFPQEAWADHWNDLRTRGSFSIESHHRTKDGYVFPVELTVNFVQFGGREYNCAFARDVTERQRLEEQLRQAQKMEAVGHLAGGVAHQFNNLLQGILGYAELIRRTLSPEDRAYRDVGEIKKASELAAVLTNQLLGFSRRQLLRMTVIDLNGLISDYLGTLRRTLGDHIELEFLPGRPLALVRADSRMLEQVLNNLSANAGDAMPVRGRLTIETRNFVIDEAFRESHRGATLGQYVQVSVTDTGTGMPPDVIEHIFEPFFTTKEVGQGTGLGLSMVYGIVKQHNGFIDANTEPGQGTTVDVYLPVEGAADRATDG